MLVFDVFEPPSIILTNKQYFLTYQTMPLSIADHHLTPVTKPYHPSHERKSHCITNNISSSVINVHLVHSYAHSQS